MINGSRVDLQFQDYTTPVINFCHYIEHICVYVCMGARVCMFCMMNHCIYNLPSLGKRIDDYKHPSSPDQECISN